MNKTVEKAKDLIVRASEYKVFWFALGFFVCSLDLLPLNSPAGE